MLVKLQIHLLHLCSPSHLHFGWKMGHLSSVPSAFFGQPVRWSCSQSRKKLLAAHVRAYICMHVCISLEEEWKRYTHTRCPKHAMIFTLHLCHVQILQNYIVQVLKFPLRLKGLLMSKLWNESWVGTVSCEICWYHSNELMSVCALHATQYQFNW